MLIVISFTTCQLSFGQMKTEEFTFEYDGKKYSGLLDLPIDEKPSAIIVMIHGHGKTNIENNKLFNTYYNLRSVFVNAGFACCIWDKAGCGKSEGEYSHNQSVQSSAKEAIASIEELRQLDIVDPDKIGLWGISRAGWINPLVIEEDKSIAFWISVSGTDNLDNYRYLLEINLRIEGRTEAELETLMSEFDYCLKYQTGGKSYDEFIKETNNLFQDPFCEKLGMGLASEEDFENIKKYYQNSGFVYDKETGLQILVPDFQKTLNNVNCPVLSISGEQDSQINWKKTIKLYKETIGKNENSSLTIKTLPNGNHTLQKCETGGLFEDNSKFKWQVCDGYYDAMLTWLEENGFGKNNN